MSGRRVTVRGVERITTGLFTVEAPCPECGGKVDVLVHLSSVLTHPQDDESTLKVRLKGKPVPHGCRDGVQTTVDDALDEDQADELLVDEVDPETGEVTSSLFREPTP